MIQNPERFPEPVYLDDIKTLVPCSASFFLFLNDSSGISASHPLCGRQHLHSESHRLTLYTLLGLMVSSVRLHIVSD